MSEWTSATLRGRHDCRVRPRRLRSLRAARSVHHRRTRARPHRRDRRERAAAAPPPQTDPDAHGTRGAAGAHHHRTQARTYFATTREPRALRRHSQEHLRPPPCERHPKSGDAASVRSRIAKGCIMKALSNCSPFWDLTGQRVYYINDEPAGGTRLVS